MSEVRVCIVNILAFDLLRGAFVRLGRGDETKAHIYRSGSDEHYLESHKLPHKTATKTTNFGSLLHLNFAFNCNKLCRVVKIATPGYFNLIGKSPLSML